MGRSIRIGTVSGYRLSDDPARRDAAEGKFSIEVKFPKRISVSNNWFDRLTHGAYSGAGGLFSGNVFTKHFRGQNNVGIVSIVDNGLSIRVVDSETISVFGSLFVDFLSIDAYALCLSKQPQPKKVLSDPDCDSVWSISSGGLFPFCNSISKYLANKLLTAPDSLLGEEFLGPYREQIFGWPPKLSSRYQLRVWCQVAPIEYRDKSITVFEQSDRIFLELFHCFDSASFIKPTSFSHEEEVRVIFRPNVVDLESGNFHLVPRHLLPTFIPFDDFLGMVEVFSDGGAF